MVALTCLERSAIVDVGEVLNQEQLPGMNQRTYTIKTTAKRAVHCCKSNQVINQNLTGDRMPTPTKPANDTTHKLTSGTHSRYIRQNEVRRKVGQGFKFNFCEFCGRWGWGKGFKFILRILR
jgi:hypothetical protein